MQNIFAESNAEFRQALKAHITPKGRTKIFNCSYKIYKKADLIPTIQQYKSGQIVEVNVSSIDDSKRFYVQQASRLADLERFDTCIQKFVAAMLSESTVNSELAAELLAFQSNTTKFDVVLALSKKENTWRRAILLEKITSSHFENVDEDPNSFASSSKLNFKQQKRQKNYFTLFFIDWGREELVITDLDEQSLVLLPVNERIMHGSFALKCALNEGSIRMRGKHGIMRIENQLEFEKKFAQNLLHKRLIMRISSITRVGNDVEATVELFYLPGEAEELKASLGETIEFDTTFSSTVSLSMKSSKLNCSHYLIGLMQAELKASSNAANVDLDVNIEKEVGVCKKICACKVCVWQKRIR